MGAVTGLQAAALVLLRTLIGWHFFYEGYVKLLAPAWSRDGVPQGVWTAAGYLQAATGPLAGWFQPLAGSAAIGWIDVLVPLGLMLVGVSLLLGLFTQLGAWSALGFLTAFYLAAIPTTGRPMPGAEGAYLLVSKTLLEWAAVLVLLVFRTGRIAGLDVLRLRRHI